MFFISLQYPQGKEHYSHVNMKELSKNIVKSCAKKSGAGNGEIYLLLNLNKLLINKILHKTMTPNLFFTLGLFSSCLGAFYSHRI